MAKGRNPRSVALDLAGRIVDGKRVGGVIGLTQKQAEAIIRARDELLGGDPAYFDRKLRDKRFDSLIRKAFAKSGGVTQAEADRITARYSDRLLNYRAEVVARTEALTALHAGQYEGMQQVIDSGKVSADQVTKTWSATLDGRARDSHTAMHNQSVKWGRAFVSPSGARLMYPQDSSLGAPADEIIQCRCHMVLKVKYL